MLINQGGFSTFNWSVEYELFKKTISQLFGKKIIIQYWFVINIENRPDLDLFS